MTGDRDDELLRWDETLLDDGESLAFDDPPEDEQLRTELLRQRLVHGLLREVNQPDRAAARERRIASIIAALPAVRASGRVIRIRPWLSLAAALIVTAVIVLVVASRSEEKRLEALIHEAVRELQQNVDRRFKLTVEQVEADGKLLVTGTHELTVRPDRFLVRMDGVSTGKWEIGWDGKSLWRRSLDPIGPVEVGALDDQRTLLEQFFGKSLLGLGYLDLARVLDSVPAAIPLRSGGRMRLKSDGPDLEAILADDAFSLLGGTVSGLIVHIDPLTDEVHRLSFRIDSPAVQPDGAYVLAYALAGILSPDFGGEALYAPPK